MTAASLAPHTLNAAFRGVAPPAPSVVTPARSSPAASSPALVSS